MTLRTVDDLRHLRRPVVFSAVRNTLRGASRDGFRVVHFSVQRNHAHFIVEADDPRRLPRGIAGLAIRIARAVNRALGRRGRVWGDRYHARALTTPLAVRHALVYVLMNHRKHRPKEPGLDLCSSALWFDGWRTRITPGVAGMLPVSAARTWLGSVGWRRHGLLRLEERPRAG